MAPRMFRFCRTVFFMLLLGTSLSVNADNSEDTTMVIGCPFTSIYNFGTLSKVTGNYEVVDYISSAFRLPSPKPYAANKKDGKFVYGADFAVEGSTALDTYFTTNNYVSKQVDQFVTHLLSICSNRQECWKKLHHAVFLVEEFGSRDYFHALSEGIKVRDVEEALVPKVVESIINSVTILIQAGARNVMVHGNRPFGCQPTYLQKFQEKSPSSKVHSYRCLRSFNRLTDLHNNRLNQALMDLSSQHPRVQIVFADYYKAFVALLKSLRKTCGGSKCGDATAVCSDPKKYIHSDENHLTQEANKFMAEAIVTAGSESFVYPKLNLPYRWHCVM
ncbi:GDSL esterase/lipase At5g03980-like [Papaver somniferum]|uniref:GDSL esterase/lipase At5g03980-like n=1 Tax=Papaver somniferum TaxID=3469 RepID=UPI000E6FB6DF|nr:GDSL esterase/lipase At5g03980-like [Papaver somniferum]